MPPSWCCTVLRLSSTLTCAGATTAPDSGAVAVHTPKSTSTAHERDERASHLPAQLGTRVAASRSPCIEQRGERGRRRCFMRAPPSGSAACDDGSEPSAGGRQGRTRGRTAAVGPNASSAPSFRTASLSSWAISVGRWPTMITRHAARLELGERRQQRELALGVEVGVRLVEHDQPRIAVERARQRDALALAAGQHRARFADLRCRSRRAAAGSSRAHARARRPRRPRSESIAPRRAMFSRHRAGEELDVLRQIADVRGRARRGPSARCRRRRAAPRRPAAARCRGAAGPAWSCPRRSGRRCRGSRPARARSRCP